MLDYASLAAVSSVVREGTFERAARALQRHALRDLASGSSSWKERFGVRARRPRSAL